MTIIVAVDKNWAIGKDGDLLFRISEDLKQFREKTSGNVIVVGRKTLESFPNSKPLKNRVNIVLTNKKDFQMESAVVCHSVEEVLAVCGQYREKEIYIAGGASVYHEFLPFCEKAIVTTVEHVFEADTFMDCLDVHPDWALLETSEPMEDHGMVYYRKIYINKNNS
ncbi:MAG: dihydrofolate reductase [Clostridiales bacterium]|nr:dihydrofolate reductase [Clostridiales bacterium]